MARLAYFEVRFIAEGIDPSKVSLRAVTDTLSAIQDLASGRDPDQRVPVPQEKRINLIRVRKGSAVYRILAHDPVEAFANLARVGALMAATFSQSLASPDIEGETIAALLRPIKSLSRVTRSLQCKLEVHRVGDSDESPLFTVSPDDFTKISERMFLSGDATVIGRVERVGGATEMRCVLRAPNQPRLLYCNVETREVARRLGEHLYKEVVALGTATWLHQSWKLFDFKVRDFTVSPQLGDAQSAVKDLRNAGLDAWDEIEDPQEFLRGV